MTTKPTEALTVRSLQSLAMLEQRRAELEALGGDRHPAGNELVLYQFLISKLQAESALHEHLAKAFLRIDRLERMSHEDRELVEAVVADHQETRRLALDAITRTNTLAATVSAGLDEMARVSRQSTELAELLAKEAAAAKEQATKVKELAGRTADLEGELKP